jgi:hypothetical protein
VPPNSGVRARILFLLTAAIPVPRHARPGGEQADPRSPRRHLEMQVEAPDREIDSLVYDLYGLTPDEIAVVEAGTGGKTG